MCSTRAMAHRSSVAKVAPPPGATRTPARLEFFFASHPLDPKKLSGVIPSAGDFYAWHSVFMQGKAREGRDRKRELALSGQKQAKQATLS